MVSPWLALVVATSTSAAAPPGKLEFEQAQGLFLERRYGEALVLYEDAYALSGQRPSTMFALAQCHRALGHFEEALRFYREYEATGLDPDEALRVANTIEAVEAQLAQQRLVQAELPKVEPPAPASPEPALVLGPGPTEGSTHLGLQLAVGGVGAVAVVTGVALGQAALADARNGEVDGTLTRGRAADGLIISGSAVLAGALLWWILD